MTPLLALLGLLAASGLSPSPPPAEPTGNGLRAVIDPVTGELQRPGQQPDLPDVAADTAHAATSTSHESLVLVERPDGSQSVHLQGRFQTVAWAEIGPDGELVVSHRPVEGLEEERQ